jgi:hypothetical protein
VYASGAMELIEEPIDDPEQDIDDETHDSLGCDAWCRCEDVKVAVCGGWLLEVEQ